MRAARLYPWLMLLWLSGCAPVAVNSSVADVDPLRRAVVEDVVLGMSDVFEPSVTPLALVRPPERSFDHALHAALRAKGFTVAAPGERGAAFDCVVDSIGGIMYRLNVRVGDTTLSRLWVLDGADAYPGGAWARKE
jgi:hypothetical protein